MRSVRKVSRRLLGRQDRGTGPVGMVMSSTMQSCPGLWCAIGRQDRGTSEAESKREKLGLRGGREAEIVDSG